MGWRVLIIGAAVAHASAAVALPFSCSSVSTIGEAIERPTPPICLSTFGIGGLSDLDVDVCRSEMGAYTLKMKDYLQCLRDEAQEAVEANNAAVRKYNCAISGQIC